MIIKSNMWPPTKKELAWLLLNYTYPQIAEMYDTNHSMVQRLRDKYRIQRLRRKDRHKLLNRRDFSKWSYEKNQSKLPAFISSIHCPRTRMRYGKKKWPATVIRALCTEIIGEIIPTFIDCHHICGHPECTNPRHIFLTIQQAHSAFHNNQVKKIPDELIIRIADHYHKCGDTCIIGKIPSVKTVGLPDNIWEEFLVNSLLVTDYLEWQIAEEKAIALTAGARLAA